MGFAGETDCVGRVLDLDRERKCEVDDGVDVDGGRIGAGSRGEVLGAAVVVVERNMLESERVGGLDVPRRPEGV